MVPGNLCSPMSAVGCSTAWAPARGGQGGQVPTLEKIRVSIAHPGNFSRGLYEISPTQLKIPRNLIVRARRNWNNSVTMFSTYGNVYNVLLMDSGQFEGADSKSDVCQLVSVEHFSRKTHVEDGRQKNKRIFTVSLAALYKALFASVIK